MTPFSQLGYRCRHDWGLRGVREAVARKDIVVVVDVMSFSTAVATAVARGAEIYPCATREEAATLAERVGAELAMRWEEAHEPGRFSLAPHTYLDIAPRTRVVLPSPNGAACCRAGQEAPYLFAGALVNAAAVARAVSQLLDELDIGVTVISCGERWQPADEGDALRPAIEDYLGAGAILAGIEHEKSPEARVCEAAFHAMEGDLEQALWECGSGRELREAEFDEDVRLAARLDLYDCVPVLWGDGALRRRQRISRTELDAVVRLMADFPHPWWIAGGWALDLFAGGEPRTHEDLEIGISREHQAAIHRHLRGWELLKMVPRDDEHGPDILPWAEGERLEHPTFQLYCRRETFSPPQFEIFLNEIIDGEWRFRRDKAVHAPAEEVWVRSAEGIPISAPEIQLLYKARIHRPKDERDFRQVRDLLSPRQRARLKVMIEQAYPGHPWLQYL